MNASVARPYVRPHTPVRDPSAWPIPGSGLSLRVAVETTERRRAYALAYRAYRALQYVEQSDAASCVASYDARPETLTLLVEDERARAVATLSLVPDGAEGLPCDALYGDALPALRHPARRLVEFTRLAVEPSARSSAIARHIMAAAVSCARTVLRCTDVVIEVNPRHVPFYAAARRFDVVCGERPCARAGGAPAVLMRLDTMLTVRAMQANQRGERPAGLGRLQSYVLGGADLVDLTSYVLGRRRSMTVAQQHYFGLAEGV